MTYFEIRNGSDVEFIRFFFSLFYSMTSIGFMNHYCSISFVIWNSLCCCPSCLRRILRRSSSIVRSFGRSTESPSKETWTKFHSEGPGRLCELHSAQLYRLNLLTFNERRIIGWIIIPLKILRGMMVSSHRQLIDNFRCDTTAGTRAPNLFRRYQRAICPSITPCGRDWWTRIPIGRFSAWMIQSATFEITSQIISSP